MTSDRLWLCRCGVKWLLAIGGALTVSGGSERPAAQTSGANQRASTVTSDRHDSSERPGGFARSPAQSSPGAIAFVIDLDTTGGFTGQGRGGVTLDSEGRVRASRFGGTSRETSQCRAQLEVGDLQSLRRAVVPVRLQAWPATFAPEGDSGCCDRIKWTLRVSQNDAEGRAKTFATMWYDGNEGRLAKEIAEIRDVAVRVLGRTLLGCADRNKTPDRRQELRVGFRKAE